MASKWLGTTKKASAKAGAFLSYIRLAASHFTFKISPKKHSAPMLTPHKEVIWKTHQNKTLWALQRQERQGIRRECFLLCFSLCQKQNRTFVILKLSCYNESKSRGSAGIYAHYGHQYVAWTVCAYSVWNPIYHIPAHPRGALYIQINFQEGSSQNRSTTL